jgi:hypothetical protein
VISPRTIIIASKKGIIAFVPAFTVGLLSCYLKNERHSLNRPDDGVTLEVEKNEFRIEKRVFT